MVGLSRFELLTSRLSGVRSNQLSYRPSESILSLIAYRLSLIAYRLSLIAYRKIKPLGPVSQVALRV
jgi:hypothetical protein